MFKRFHILYNISILFSAHTSRLYIIWSSRFGYPARKNKNKNISAAAYFWDRLLKIPTHRAFIRSYPGDSKTIFLFLQTNFKVWQPIKHAGKHEKFCANKYKIIQKNVQKGWEEQILSVRPSFYCKFPEPCIRSCRHQFFSRWVLVRQKFKSNLCVIDHCFFIA